MEEQKQIYRIFWEKTSNQSARILRVFTDLPVINIPNQIAQYPVTEIGNYCFAPDCQLPNTFLISDTGTSSTAVTEVCGNYLESIQLPDTLEKIGDYAFYNCRFLSKISFASRVQEIGSDAFMNCHNLHQIFLRCNPSEKTGLQRVLTQISWDVEVSFLGNGNLNPAHKKAVILYPEYYEAYDEIAPAHIFGRKIVGEGFRARQCFKDGMVAFSQYDKIFEKACIEESEQILCRLAFHRLHYPYELSDINKLKYTNYILAHGKILCQQFVKDKRIHDFLFLLQENLLSAQTIQYALTQATQADWSEGSARILRWQHHHNHSSTRTKYQFEKL